MNEASQPTVLRQIVSRVEVTGREWLEDDRLADPETGSGTIRFVYVYPIVGDDASELRLDERDDLDQWIDDTGLIWPQEVRASLREQLPRATFERPVIVTRNIALDDQRDQAISAMVEANDPPVFFRRGGYVTEVRRNENNVPSTRDVSVTRMRDRLADVAHWTTAVQREITEDGIRLVPKDVVKPPADIAANLLETPGLQLPALEAIVEHPVMAKDGRISTRRGYDSGTATYYAPSVASRQLDLEDDSGPPTAETTRIALSWIDELLYDFEFAGRADKEHVLALMLTPILRPIIEGPVPMAVVRAAKAGTGKSLLVESVMTALIGRKPPRASIGTDEDEAEKRLLAAFLSGTQFFYLDNVPTGRVLSTGALSRAIDSTVWEGRVITTSKYPTLPIRCTWIATGNNLTMSDEVSRRAYMIELDSAWERPDLRKEQGYRFRHKDLPGWVRQNRTALLQSALIIARAWSADGMRITEGRTLASFEEWSAVIGSVLRFAGMQNFLGNESRKREIAEDDANIERVALIDLMSDMMGSEPFTLKDFHRKTFLSDDAATVVSPFLTRARWADAEAIKELGNAIRPVLNASYGGLRLKKVERGGSDKVTKYRVMPG